MIGEEKLRIGVVIGRFQTPCIHEGHKYLIAKAIENSDHLIVLIGVSDTVGEIEDPLDFATRDQMLSSYLAFKTKTSFVIAKVKDHPSDSVWSQRVDREIEKAMVDLYGDVTLYGGRDSFIPYYDGVYDTVEIEAIDHEGLSSTEMRKNQPIINSEEFRGGMVHQANIAYPKAYPTVDIAIMDPKMELVLLGRKAGEQHWRFPGGFVDPTDDDLESAAAREAKEETNADIYMTTYLMSTLVDDWRYKKRRNKIMTTFFLAKVANLEDLKAGDDLEEIAWALPSAAMEFMLPGHQVLMAKLIHTLQNLMHVTK